MNKYNFHPQVVLRAPIRPFSDQLSVKDLEQLLQDQQIQEALFLASPNLHRKAMLWLRQELAKDEIKGLQASLYKYLSRMHVRCTPFGLFASCSLADWGSATSGVLESGKSIERHTRLDMNFLYALSQYFEQHASIRPHLTFGLNSSLHRQKDHIHYIEYYWVDNVRKYKVSSVELDDYLQVVLSTAEQAQKLSVFCEALINYDSDIQLEEAYAYLNSMVDAQILVSELEPTITGKEFFDRLLEVITPLATVDEAIKEIVEVLRQIERLLLAIDQRKVNQVSDYHQISELIRSLGIEFDVSKLFQVDTFRSTPAIQIDQKWKKEIKQCLQFLDRINHYQDQELSDLSNFISAFYRRYEHQEVPLQDVLDTNLGLGFPVSNQSSDTNPLTKDLLINSDTGTGQEMNWNKYEQLIFDLILSNQTSEEVRLDQQEGIRKIIDEEKTSDLPLHESIYCTLSILNQDRIQLNGAGGSSAINLLSRFAHGNQQIKHLVKEVVEVENSLQQKDSILAEVVHLPQSRTGNILMHPDFRDYEIPYLARSTKSQEQQIPVSDITISLDLSGQQIILRSRKLNKRIYPRLSNAHNFVISTLPIYRFLCALQQHGKKQWLLFNLGRLQLQYRYIPRICWKRVVLSPATWNLKARDFQSLKADTLIQWWQEQKLPQRFFLLEGDNQLYFNLISELAREVFIREIKKKKHISIQEYLPTHPGIQDNTKAIYRNEVFAFLHPPVVAPAKPPRKQVSTRKTTLRDESLRRTFFLGSEWLYYKIYLGAAMADRLISKILLPRTEEYRKKGWIKNWFFIRYHDPENHLRVRFQLSSPQYLTTIVADLQTELEDLLNTGVISKVMTDTYQREVERYGQSTMELSEIWFGHDSRSTAKMLAMIEGDSGEAYRWLYAARAIDELLNLFVYDLAQRKSLLQMLRQSFAEEFGVRKQLRKQITNKYRAHKKLLAQTLDRTQDQYSKLNPLFEILKEQAHAAQINIDGIRKEAELPLDYLLSSYIHMLCNRVFKTQQRKAEMVLYDFMTQYYTTQFILSKKLQTA